jgi:arylsulfatase A-like enzyme
VRRELAGKLSAVDEALKNVTHALEAKGMLSNTIIFYTADK